MTRSLSIAALLAGVLGSIGAGGAASNRVPIDISMGVLDSQATAIMQPMPEACGCIRNDVNGSHPTGFGLAVHTEDRLENTCAEQLWIDAEAGFEGTRTATVGWCDLTVTASRDLLSAGTYCDNGWTSFGSLGEPCGSLEPVSSAGPVEIDGEAPEHVIPGSPLSWDIDACGPPVEIER